MLAKIGQEKGLAGSGDWCEERHHQIIRHGLVTQGVVDEQGGLMCWFLGSQNSDMTG